MLLDQVKNKINLAKNLFELNEIRVQILGKNGILAEEFKKISALSIADKKEFGQKINYLKNTIENLINDKKNLFEYDELNEKLNKEKLDVTISRKYQKSGKIHPITQAEAELTNIFSYLGFSIKEGNSIETDWYNFTALNMLENHPARQMHDTFYLPDNGANKMLLRTHTSNVQIHTMESEKPPYRFIAPGRAYRSDYDQTHTPMFHQIEGFAVDKDINMAQMKYVIIEFVKAFFEGQDIKIRFRPSFFPFTTHSAEVDIGFSNDKEEKWLEILGCGMVHPNVLKNGGVDSEIYQGFAFGLGIERMAMLKYGIKDLRQFFESDIRWLDHYNFSTFDIPSLLGGLTK